MVKLTELILLGQWRQPVSLYGVLADAAARQVLKAEATAGSSATRACARPSPPRTPRNSGPEPGAG